MTEYDAPAVEELGDVAQLTRWGGHSGFGDHDTEWEFDDDWWWWT